MKTTSSTYGLVQTQRWECKHCGQREVAGTTIEMAETIQLIDCDEMLVHNVLSS